MKLVAGWLGGSTRRNRRLGKELSLCLLLLGDKDAPRKADFVVFTLRQRQPYLTFLLRHSGLENEATRVEGLNWTEGHEVAARYRGLRDRNRFETAHKVYGGASEAALAILRNPEVQKSKTLQLAVLGAYADASLSIKHSWRTQAKFWSDLTRRCYDALTAEEAAAANPEHEALRDAAVSAVALIEMTAHVRKEPSKDPVSKLVEAALREQISWVLGPHSGVR